MLKVQTFVQSSLIHGVGLFAAEDIPKGAVIWEPERGLDLIITKEEYDGLSSVGKAFVDHYGYWSEELQRFICAADNYRFVNHSEEPNLVNEGAKKGSDGRDVAARDIRKGEELTFDYRGFGEDPSI